MAYLTIWMARWLDRLEAAGFGRLLCKLEFHRPDTSGRCIECGDWPE